MSSFDPLSGIIADAALAQSSVAAIDLGVQIEILQQQLQVGDLLTATILPPQNGVDLLSLFGQTVQAQLPPGIDPGQTLLLQVTGFQGNQILVRNIGVVDPENPPPTVTVELPPSEPGATTQATLYTVQPPQTRQSAQQPQPSESVTVTFSKGEAQTPPSSTTQPPVAPPRAVFVAASVQNVQPASSQPAAAQNPVPIVVPPENELVLEARIAATRAASIDLEELVNQSAPVKAAPSQPAAPQLVQQAPRAAQLPPATPAPVPAIAPRTTTPASAMAPDLAMLARLRIPVLPFTLAAARLANTAASALPKALARLDALLELLPQADARAATVRTLAAFLDKIDLTNTRALPEQLMAYINNVVDGAESKLAALVRALTVADDEPAPPDADNPLAAPNAPVPNAGDDVTLSLSKGDLQSTPTDAPAANFAPSQPTVAAQAAERAVALQYDLKTAIAALADSPPQGAPPQLAGALSDALTAITAAQLNVINGQTNDPNTLVIPLPVFYCEGGRPAQLRISRDAPEGGKKLDSDNFHIAFILDTKSLGTVAVDVQTASRSVSVNVKTEVQASATRFRDTLDDLRGRLEQLHYRVANIAATVAPRTNVTASNAGEASVVDGRKSNVDLQA